MWVPKEVGNGLFSRINFADMLQLFLMGYGAYCLYTKIGDFFSSIFSRELPPETEWEPPEWESPTHEGE